MRDPVEVAWLRTESVPDPPSDWIEGPSVGFNSNDQRSSFDG
jgi:hypothetical protein